MAYNRNEKFKNINKLFEDELEELDFFYSNDKMDDFRNK